MARVKSDVCLFIRAGRYSKQAACSYSKDDKSGKTFSLFNFKGEIENLKYSKNMQMCRK